MDIKKYGQTYEAPENRDQFVDVEKGEVIDKENIPPLEVIKAIAKRYNIQISDPNKGCKHCYGRGYTGREAKTKVPIMCMCLFRDRTNKQKYLDMQAAQMYGHFNHDTRRKMKQNLHKRLNMNSVVAKNIDNERAAMVGVSATPGPTIDIFKSSSPLSASEEPK